MNYFVIKSYSLSSSDDAEQLSEEDREANKEKFLSLVASLPLKDQEEISELAEEMVRFNQRGIE